MPQVTIPSIDFVEDATLKNCDTSYNVLNIHTLTFGTHHLMGSDQTIKSYAYGLQLEFSTRDDSTTCTMYLSYDSLGKYLVLPEKTVNMQIGQDVTVSTADFNIDYPFKHRDTDGNTLYVWVKVNLDTAGNLKCVRSTLAHVALL